MPITGKQRAQKIDPKYHTRRDSFLNWKRWLGFIGLTLGLGYSGWLVSDQGKAHVSTGPLSRAHHAWNDTGCDHCHTPYLPIRLDSLWGSAHATIAKNNQKCNGSCHSLPGHFVDATLPDIAAGVSCSQCHREHLGFDRNLVEVPDSDCAQCHKSLERVAKTTPKVHPVASHFNDAHPVAGFESLTKDPGTIKFSHVQHMRPGQPRTPGDATAKRLENLPAQYRDRYAPLVDSDGWIQLQCADCHDPIVQNVQFENHCVACHSLDGIPHGLNRQLTLDAIASQLPSDLFQYFKNRKGEQAIDEGEIREREIRLQSLASSQTEGCMKCHLPAPEASNAMVQSSQVPARWMPKANFSHDDHRMASCQSCHPQPFEESTSSVDSLLEADRIMIRGIEHCRTCHVEDPVKRAQQFASNPHVATANCVDCHSYHADGFVASVRSQSMSFAP